MSTFVQTSSPTPWSFFDQDASFQTDADKMVTFVKTVLGDPVLSVELTKKMIWASFEEATLEYSRVINEHQAKSQLATYLGTATGSLSGSEQRYARESLDFLLRSAEPYAGEAGVGGSFNTVSGSILLEQGRQDYDIYTECKDQGGNVIFDNLTIKGKMKIFEVFHFSPSTAYRFFNSTSALNYLNNEFSFESFTPETVFYVLPVFEDLLRAGMMKVSQKVRRSQYSYKIVGTKIRIYPMPNNLSTFSNLNRLWLRLGIPQNPNSPAYQDSSIYGVSNVANIPYGEIMYSAINSIGRQWIREYTLALCLVMLGRIRSKMKTIPIPGGDVTLNGEDLIQQGQSEKERLQTSIKELLDSLTYDKLAEQQVNKAELMIRQLRTIPIPFPITVG